MSDKPTFAAVACADCRFYTGLKPADVRGSYNCQHPNVVTMKPRYTTGGTWTTDEVYCGAVRKDESKCGHEARWFEPVPNPFRETWNRVRNCLRNWLRKAFR